MWELKPVPTVFAIVYNIIIFSISIEKMESLLFMNEEWISIDENSHVG